MTVDQSNRRRALHTRRQALGIIGAGLVASPALAVPARPNISDPSAPYRVPGGRIGFQRPQGIAPTTNGWILQSADHTFQVRVQETVFVPGGVNPLWDKDKTTTLVGTPEFAGFSARRFKDLRNLQNVDYGHESIVLAGENWLGEVSVSISNLSDQAETTEVAPQAAGLVRPASGPDQQAATGVAPTASGLVARWKAAADLVLGSITVRAAQAADVAMAEFGVALDGALNVADLHPRFAGDKLILSPKAATTSAEVLGTGMAHIAMPGMSNLDYILEDANTDLYEFFRMTGLELSGGACRAVQTGERRLADGRVTSSIRVFGKRRQQEITAVYAAGDRAPMLEALSRTYKSLRFLDEA